MALHYLLWLRTSCSDRCTAPTCMGGSPSALGSDALNKAAGEEAGSAVAVASQATMREETHGWADSLVRGRGQG